MSSLNEPCPDEANRKLGMALYHTVTYANALEAKLAQVSVLHANAGHGTCVECWHVWPCATRDEVAIDFEESTDE